MELLVAKLILAVVMVGAGAALIWVARAAASGRLRRNGIAGIRTRATLASDEAWLAAHRAGRSLTESGGWCAIATGVLILFVGSDIQLIVAVGGGTAVMTAMVIGGAVRGTRAANRLS